MAEGQRENEGKREEEEGKEEVGRWWRTWRKMEGRKEEKERRRNTEEKTQSNTGEVEKKEVKGR